MGYRKQLPIRTEQLKAMGEYSIKRRKGTLIEEQFKQTMQYRMKQASTPAEKREIIRESNPLFYIFGEVQHGIK